MIDLTFDFKTVGGVANIYVIPPSAFGGITTNYATKRHSIQVTSFDTVIQWVSSLPAGPRAGRTHTQ